MLPSDWLLDEDSLREPQRSWPLEWLKNIAAELRARTVMPETPALFPNGDPPQPLGPNTRQSAWMGLLALGQSQQMPDCRWIDFHDLFSIIARKKRTLSARRVTRRWSNDYRSKRFHCVSPPSEGTWLILCKKTLSGV